jgi:thiamine-phosphate pyrophosphorylase
MRLYAITDRRLYPGDEGERCSALARQVARWVQAGVDIIQLREKDLPAEALEELAGRVVSVAENSALELAPHMGLRLGDGSDPDHERDDGLDHGRGSAVGPVLARPSGRVSRQAARPAGGSLILVNGGQVGGGGAASIARRAGADGIHLTGWEAFGGNGRATRERVQSVRDGWPDLTPAVSVACHTVEEARAARLAGASMVLFAPVFQKRLWNSGGALLPGTGLEALAAACEEAWPVPVFALGGVTIDNAGKCLDAGAAGIAGIRLFAHDGWIGLARW